MYFFFQVEHSLFPRKRTLLGRARGHHTDRNALRNKYLATQAGKEAKNGPRGHHHEPGYQMPGQTSGTNNAVCIIIIVHVTGHGLRTPSEGINQRYLKNWADVVDNICFGRT